MFRDRLDLDYPRIPLSADEWECILVREGLIASAVDGEPPILEQQDGCGGVHAPASYLKRQCEILNTLIEVAEESRARHADYQSNTAARAGSAVDKAAVQRDVVRAARHAGLNRSTVRALAAGAPRDLDNRYIVRAVIKHWGVKDVIEDEWGCRRAGARHRTRNTSRCCCM
ncbi:hypothetical protein CDCA_CDCA02G0692 [Cyanidium caldarium]|uniref:Uncharacterized protein n=1 Tax=Cyanidium caldarium TaxID=2771 RepID=A0AAV9IQZ9_CYACA|nr:hypothetical protein CDCA_CDCA02G0692 [Cyanidium caldarium]